MSKWRETLHYQKCTDKEIVQAIIEGVTEYIAIMYDYRLVDKCSEGICGYLNVIGGRGYDLLIESFKNWPEFSGEECFPVKSIGIEQSPQVFWGSEHRRCFEINKNRGDLNKGEYGKSRLCLAKFIIQYITETYVK